MNTPKEVKELASKLSKSWYQYGVVTVDPAYGVACSTDSQPARWRLFAFTHEPDRLARILPHEIEGYPVDFKTAEYLKEI